MRTIQLPSRCGLNRSTIASTSIHSYPSSSNRTTWSSFAKLKLLLLDANHAHADDAQIQLGQFATQIEIDLNGRSAVRVGRRRLSICHALKDGA